MPSRSSSRQRRWWPCSRRACGLAPGDAKERRRMLLAVRRVAVQVLGSSAPGCRAAAAVPVHHGMKCEDL